MNFRKIEGVCQIHRHSIIFKGDTVNVCRHLSFYGKVTVEWIRTEDVLEYPMFFSGTERFIMYNVVHGTDDCMSSLTMEVDKVKGEKGAIRFSFGKFVDFPKFLKQFRKCAMHGGIVEVEDCIFEEVDSIRPREWEMK